MCPSLSETAHGKQRTQNIKNMPSLNAYAVLLEYLAKKSM
jgi:hypothetical protein